MLTRRSAPATPTSATDEPVTIVPEAEVGPTSVPELEVPEPTAIPPLSPAENTVDPSFEPTVNSLSASSHACPQPLPTSRDDTSAVERTRLGQATDNSKDPARLPAHRVPAATVTSSPFRPTLRKLCFLLIAVTAPLVAFLVVVYANAARYYALLPAFCRLPGMEPYRSTSHCLNYPYVGLGPDMNSVSPNTPLLDGPPPSPIYWADFQGLYDLQHKIIDCMRSAFVFEGAVVLKFIDDDVSNEQSSMHQLRMEVQRRDYMKERMLRNSLYEGSRLGKKLHRLCQGSKSMAQRFVGSNRRAYEGIEENILKQPRSHLVLAFLELIPRIRSDPWTWETDIEVRLQFYRSLTLLSEALYDNLLALKELPTELEGFKRDLAALRSLLTKKEGVTQLQSTGTTKSSIFSWYKATRSGEDAVAMDADNSHEAMKMALFDRMDRDVNVALERANATLGVLRALSEDMESMRLRVASPRPDVPLFIHFRHIYVEDERLSKLLEDM